MYKSKGKSRTITHLSWFALVKRNLNDSQKLIFV